MKVLPAPVSPYVYKQLFLPFQALSRSSIQSFSNTVSWPAYFGQSALGLSQILLINALRVFRKPTVRPKAIIENILLGLVLVFFVIELEAVF